MNFTIQYGMNGAPGFADYIRILPEIVLSVFGMIIMLLDPVLDEESSQKTLGGVALLGSVVAILATLYQSQLPGLAFWDMAVSYTHLDVYKRQAFRLSEFRAVVSEYRPVGYRNRRRGPIDQYRPAVAVGRVR